jgi:membrane carboxypeptidase/penicillin-binding protein PbpC
MHANPSCPARITEWLPVGEAALPCSWHHDTEEGPIVVWPAVYRQWAQAHGLTVPPRSHQPELAGAEHRRDNRPVLATSGSRPTQPLAINNPPSGAVYLIDPTLRIEYQTVALRASADGDAGRIEWSVDGERIGTSNPNAAVHWPLAPGEHLIVAADARGNTAESTIVVK